MRQLYIITGAKGHLASTIIRYLRKQDCEIRGLILPSETGEDDEQLTYYKGDVTKPETLDDIFMDIEDREVIVIHTAAIISIGETVTPQLYRVNVEGTRNVIEKCRSYAVKRLVYVSSVHAIPESGQNATISEVESFTREAVTGAYASTKAEASQEVMDAAKNGLDAVIVHPSGIIGPYDDGSNHIVQMIQMRLSGRLPAGVTGGYDFVDVRDVAKGCLLAAEKGKTGSCYILSNRYFSLRELLECVRRVVGGRRIFSSRLESQRRAYRFLPGLRRSEIPGLSLPDMHSIRFRAMTVSPMIREPLSLATCPVICRKPFVIRSTGSRGKMWHCRHDAVWPTRKPDK